MPETASAHQVAPAAESDGLPSLSPDLLSRARRRDPGTIDDSGGILCRKGTASATRWRSYDHKDVFEPARGATAPPSDAIELGSWDKYEGPRPRPADTTKAVDDEEHPTSWFKYDTKPVASLLEPIEQPRPKAGIDLAESAPIATASVLDSAAPVESPPATEIKTEPVAAEPTVVPKEAANGTDTPIPVELSSMAAVPSTQDPPLEVAETVAAVPEAVQPILEDTAQSPRAEVPENVAPEPTMAEPADLPILREASPPMGPSTSVEAEPVSAALISSETSLSPTQAPLPHEPPKEPEPLEHTEPAIALDAASTETLPIEARELPLSEPGNEADVPAQAEPVLTVDKPRNAAPPTLPLGPSISVEAEPVQAALAPSETSPIPMQESLPDQPPEEPEALERTEPAPTLDTASSEIPPIEAPEALQGEARNDADVSAPAEPATAIDSLRDAPISHAAELPVASVSTHVDKHEPAPAADEPLRVVPSRPKTAMLARLAAMLEQAMSAKRSDALDAAPTAASADALKSSEPTEPIVAETAVEQSSDFAIEYSLEGANAAETAIEPPAAEASEAEPLAAAAPPEETPAEVVVSHDEPGQPEARDTSGDASIEALARSPVEADVVAAPAGTPQHEPETLLGPAPGPEDRPRDLDAGVEKETFQRELAPPAAAVKIPDPVRKAMLARLTEMFERAVSKRAARPSAEPSAQANLSGAAEPAAPAETFLAPTEALPEPSSTLPEALAPTEPPLTPPEAPAASAATEAEAAALPEAREEPAFTIALVPSEAGPPEESLDPVNAPEVAEAAPTPSIEALHEGDTVSGELPQHEPVPAPEATDEVAGLAQEGLQALPAAPPPSTSDSDGETNAAALAETTTKVEADTALSAIPAEGRGAAGAAASDAPTTAEEAPRLIEESSTPPATIALDAAVAPRVEHEPTVSEPASVPAAADSAPTDETSEPIATAADTAAEPSLDAVAVNETAAVDELPSPAIKADPPLTPAQQERAVQQALAHDLSDVIYDVLSTTRFATKSLKPKRHAEVEPVEPRELSELAEELTASLPHPVATRSRVGRLERALGFASVGMLVVIGYFAYSLWHGEGAAPVRAPSITVAAPPSAAGDERTRDVRDLGSVATATEAPRAQPEGPEPGVAKPVARPRARQSLR